MTEPVTIEFKGWSDVQTAKILLRQLKRQNLTGADLTVDQVGQLTAVPHHQIEPGLMFLAGKIGGDVKLNADGEPVFCFNDLDKKPWVLTAPRWAHRPVTIATRFLRYARSFASTILFSNIVGTVCVAYCVLAVGFFGANDAFIFVVLLGLAAFLAYLPTLLTLFLLAILISPFFAGLNGLSSFITSLIFYVPAIVLLVGLCALSFTAWAKVGSLFGTLIDDLGNFGRAHVGRLVDEQRFLNMVGNGDGQTTLGELMVLYGWSANRAFDELTQLMLDYRGDVDVTDGGDLVFKFPNFEHERGAGVVPIWKREREPGDLFDDAARAADKKLAVVWLVTIIPAIAGFGLMFPSIEVFSAAVMDDIAVTCGFVCILLLAPAYIAIRRALVSHRQRNYASRRAMLKVMREAVENSGRVETDAMIPSQIVLDLQGDLMDSESRGQKVVYEFPLLRHVRFGP